MIKLLALVSTVGLSGICFAGDTPLPAGLSGLMMPSVSAIRRIEVPAPAAPVEPDPCAAMNALADSKDEAAARTIAAAIGDSDPGVRRCAIRAAGESRNKLAVDPLLAGVEAYVRDASRDPYEEKLKAKLSAIDSIWSLGEIGDPKVLDALVKLYAGSDEVIRMNLVMGIGKIKTPAAVSFLKGTAASENATMATRSAAFEMLAEINDDFRLSAFSPSLVSGVEKADLIYSGGLFGIPHAWIKELPIGHSGLFVKAELKDGKIVAEILDCVPNYFPAPNGVRHIYSWKHFTHEFKYPYYGDRSSKVRPTPAQREKIIQAAAAKVGHKYGNSHTEQQGPDLFDCVGYTEYAYEVAGVNPTPEEYEIGLGWPLTPMEQFIATVPNIHP